jgi:ethanolamine ammonia-lyase small subunit
MPNPNLESIPVPPGNAPSHSDAWSGLTRFTNARIARGRAGGSWRTETLLEFRLAHAQARDAVGKTFAPDALEADLHQAGYETLRLSTAVNEPALFLKRPDLGRKLSDDSRRLLIQKADAWADRQLAVIISDGLSAQAAEKQAAPTLIKLLSLLSQIGWKTCPIFIAPFARVKLQDEIGALLHVRHTLMLLGERPGLGSPDSLGAYFTYEPRPNRTDADRTCVSNIRPDGFPPTEAALKLAQLLLQSLQQRRSGIGLMEPAESARNRLT